MCRICIPIPMLLQFNPAVISIEDVRQGGFLSGGTQEVAIVERVDKERGQAIISATRMPNTPGRERIGNARGDRRERRLLPAIPSFPSCK